MTRPLRIADADTHVVEPNDLWPRYLEEEFRDRAPVVLPTPGSTLSHREELHLRASLHLAGRRLGVAPKKVQASIDHPRTGAQYLRWNGERIHEPIPEGFWEQDRLYNVKHCLRSVLSDFDAESHAQALRELEIERAHLIPSIGLWLFAIDSMEPTLAAALVRAYNNWLRDFCAHDAVLLRGVGAVCRHEPRAMVEEVKRVADWGWTAVTLRPNPLAGRLLSDAAYEPFWAECERLGMAVAIHEGTGGRLPTTGRDRFRTNFSNAICSHPMEQMMALLALIEGGVLERHPGLKVAFLEAGCGWLPYWLNRMDARYAFAPWEVEENVRMKPSDYFRRQCFIACEPEEPCLEDVVDLVGGDRLLYGTDFPHFDHEVKTRTHAQALVDRLGPEAARKILWDNTCRFYGTAD